MTPTSAVVEVDNTFWLLNVAPTVSHHEHAMQAAAIKPIPLPPAKSYEIIFAYVAVPPGAHSAIHVQSGPEAWYVLAGSQCVENQTRCCTFDKAAVAWCLPTRRCTWSRQGLRRAERSSSSSTMPNDRSTRRSTRGIHAGNVDSHVRRSTFDVRRSTFDVRTSTLDARRWTSTRTHLGSLEFVVEGRTSSSLYRLCNGLVSGTEVSYMERRFAIGIAWRFLTPRSDWPCRLLLPRSGTLRSGTALCRWLVPLPHSPSI